MPVRIRFEYTRYPHLGDRSGYVQLVRHLDPQRYRTVLHGASDSDADLPRLVAPLRPWLRRFIRRGGMPWYKLSDLTAEVRALPGCLASSFEIIHFLDGEHSAQYLPRLIRMSRISSTRTVATFHQPPEVARELVDGDLLRWIDHIILVSPSQLPFFSQHVPENRLHVLLHGIDADFFYPNVAPNRTRRIRCITAGHWLRDWEAFRSVTSALRDATDITFDVVASREAALDHLPNVTIHSGIDDATLAGLYRAADILFLPLIQSTANNTLLEGIASGLPVVATDLEAVRAYLPGGEGILVAGNRVDAFVDALRRLQQDVELRQDIGRRARARAEELAWPYLVREYEAFYTSVAPRQQTLGVGG